MEALKAKLNCPQILRSKKYTSKENGHANNINARKQNEPAKCSWSHATKDPTTTTK